MRATIHRPGLGNHGPDRMGPRSKPFTSMSPRICHRPPPRTKTTDFQRHGRLQYIRQTSERADKGPFTGDVGCSMNCRTVAALDDYLNCKKDTNINFDIKSLSGLYCIVNRPSNPGTGYEAPNVVANFMNEIFRCCCFFCFSADHHSSRPYTRHGDSQLMAVPNGGGEAPSLYT